MNAIKKKLNSQRGASMILVLALFLVCVMVSSVILAAASTGMTRNEKRIQQQRAYLAVSSAADLIVEEIRALGTYTSTNKEMNYNCEDCTVKGSIIYNGEIIRGYRVDVKYLSNPLDDGHLFIKNGPGMEPHTFKVIVDDDDDEDDEIIVEDRMDGLLEDLFRRGCRNAVSGSYTEEFTIALPEEDNRLPKVTCVFTMDKTYAAKFVIKAENNDYAVSITCDADRNTTEPILSEEPDFHDVYYNKYSVTGYTVVVEPWDIPIDVVSYDVEIQWINIKVEKEVLSQ